MRRLEKAAKVAMEDAHRRACIESATLRFIFQAQLDFQTRHFLCIIANSSHASRSSSSANTPTSYAPSTLNQMNLAELGNHHLLLERRIAELNDELARVFSISLVLAPLSANTGDLDSATGVENLSQVLKDQK